MLWLEFVASDVGMSPGTAGGANDASDDSRGAL
jgi:hypothetical protein